jgi:hypothetical protein
MLSNGTSVTWRYIQNQRTALLHSECNGCTWHLVIKLSMEGASIADQHKLLYTCSSRAITRNLRVRSVAEA